MNSFSSLILTLVWPRTFYTNNMILHTCIISCSPVYDYAFVPDNYLLFVLVSPTTQSVPLGDTLVCIEFGLGNCILMGIILRGALNRFRVVNIGIGVELMQLSSLWLPIGTWQRLEH